MNRRQFLSAAGPLAAAGAVCSSMAVPEQPTELRPGQVWVRGEEVFIVEEFVSDSLGRYGLMCRGEKCFSCAVTPTYILSDWTYRGMIRNLVR